MGTVAGGIAKLELFNNLRKVPPTDEEVAQGMAYPPGDVHLPKVEARDRRNMSGGRAPNGASRSPRQVDPVCFGPA